MRHVAAFVALLIGATTAHADTTADNLAKSWRLRDRLVTQFVSVGTQPGQSEPAPERTDSAGLMKWGDGTTALGFYLGVLATEHYMLADPARFPGADGGDPSRLAANEEELYDALLALERLDDVADAAFPSPCSTTPALNGFFVRDDVPADFSGHFPGITTIQSDFIDPILTNKEESQDQVYHVQHGLALVVTLVPASVVVQGSGGPRQHRWRPLQLQGHLHRDPLQQRQQHDRDRERDRPPRQRRSQHRDDRHRRGRDPRQRREQQGRVGERLAGGPHQRLRQPGPAQGAATGEVARRALEIGHSRRPT